MLVAKGDRDRRRRSAGDRSARSRRTRPTSSIPPHRTLAEIEKMAILQTLQRTNWNKQEAAQILGLYRPTLYSKMKKHDIRDGAKPRAAAVAGARHPRHNGGVQDAGGRAAAGAGGGEADRARRVERPRGFLRSDNLTYAASIAYYALLSIFPFFLLVFAIARARHRRGGRPARGARVRPPLLPAAVPLSHRAARRAAQQRLHVRRRRHDRARLGRARRVRRGQRGGEPRVGRRARGRSFLEAQARRVD